MAHDTKTDLDFSDEKFHELPEASNAYLMSDAIALEIVNCALERLEKNIRRETASGSTRTLFGVDRDFRMSPPLWFRFVQAVQSKGYILELNETNYESHYYYVDWSTAYN